MMTNQNKLDTALLCPQCVWGLAQACEEVPHLSGRRCYPTTHQELQRNKVFCGDSVRLKEKKYLPQHMSNPEHPYHPV